MKFLKQSVLCLLLIGGMSLLAFGEVADRIVAVVNQKVITLYQVRKTEQELLAQKAFSPELPLKKRQEKIMNYLVENELVRQAAEQSGIMVSDEDLQRALDDIKQRNKLVDDEQLREIVSRQEGKTWEEFLAGFREQIKTARLINQEVRSKVDVSDAEVEAYFQNNKEQFEQVPALYHVRHLLLTVPEHADDSTVQEIQAKAEELVGEVRNGADFAELAAQYSEHPSAKKGGELGKFEEGQLVSPFDIAFGMKSGAVSQPVRTDLGFHLIYVQEKIGGAQATFEQSRSRIRQKLFEEKTETLYQQWMDELKEQAYVEIK